MTGDSAKISELDQETAPENLWKVPVVKTDLSGDPVETVYMTIEDLQRIQDGDPIEISSAEIKLLFGSPFTLIPAPGAGKAIRVLGITAFNEAGAAAYTLVDLFVDIGYDTTQIIAQLTKAWAQSTTNKMYSPPIANPGTDVENKPIIMWTPTTNPAAGTGTWYVKIDYTIHDFN